MLPSARKCATYTMTLWSASHCSNMVVVPVATCQDLAENGLPQLMPSPARLRSHIGSPNKVKVISKEPRLKVQRSKWLRFENISTETDVSDKTRNLHAEQLCTTSKTLIYVLFHMKGGHVCYSTFTIVTLSVCYGLQLHLVFFPIHILSQKAVVDQPVIPYE